MEKSKALWVRNTLAGIVAMMSLLAMGAASGFSQSGRHAAELFAVLPDGSTAPEGLTVDADGNVFVPTFGFNQTGGVDGPGELFVFSPAGRLLRHIAIAGSSSHLLGLGFHPLTGALLVIDFGTGRVLSVDPVTGGASVFMTTSGSPGLNGITFDHAGNVYVSDSFQGIIWKAGPGGGAATAWVSDPLLTTQGVPPFGANGIEFNKAESILYVTNSGNDTVLQIPVINGTPGKPTIFVNSINGADGLAIDSQGNLWVAANQNAEIVVVSPAGKLLARMGDFEGVDDQGVPHGLLLPASPAFSNDGEFLYVTNLALDLRVIGVTQAVDSQWCAKVKRFTISRMRTRFRPLAE